jgi:glycosyltransferase involved in cell wall biosynthesis
MNPAPVDISVAICTWNRCESLKATLEHMSLLRIPDGVTWELLLVNNNCTDRTDEVCAAFRDRLPIKVLHESRPGLSFARNRAIAEARGDLLVWTDDDVLVFPDWLAGLLAAYRDHGASWVFGPSEPAWPGAAPAWYSPRLSGNFAVLDYGPTPFVAQDKDKPFFGLNFGGTRSAHAELGGFNTEYGLIGTGGGVGEDVDLFERALKAGMKVVYAPAARVKHVIPPARATKKYQRQHIWKVSANFYSYMGEMFPEVPWFLGVPRFMFASAMGHLAGYGRSVLSRDPGRRFFHELQLLRFSRFFVEAAKKGFARPDRSKKQGVAGSSEVGR